MPAPLIKSFAKKTDYSEKEIEDKFEKAKDAVKKQYPDVKVESDRFYALVVGVLKKMIGLSEGYITFREFLKLKNGKVL